MLRALIVDDESPARAELRFQLERHRDVQVIGEAQNAREALALVGAVDYDVIFLDIQMPSMTGLDLAEGLHQGRLQPPYVVFVTAHDQHTLRAFGLSAVDYLLKPVAGDRLAQTLDRLRALKARSADGGAEASGQPEAGPSDAPRFLSGSQGEAVVPVPLREVAYLAADGDAVRLVTTGGRRLQVRSTLQELEMSLPEDAFFRSHRAFIVNLSEVSEIVPFFNGTYVLRMKGGDEVHVSRARARRLRELFGLTP